MIEKLRSLTRRIRPMFVAPLLAVVALSSWALASPVGGSPDDDFHLASIWCADVIAPDCATTNDPAERVVPASLQNSGCYKRLPDESARCLDGVPFDPSDTIVTTRGNFLGNYPPLFYATMGLFASSDIPASVVAMRVVNVLIFVAITCALAPLLTPSRRAALFWGWLIATVPLGIYLIPSVNPSSWAIVGVGTSWLALLGWFESTGRRKVGLGVLFALGIAMAAGSRSDAAAFAALGIAVVGVLTLVRSRRWALDAILPTLALVACVVSVMTSGQSANAVAGFDPGGVSGGDAGGAAPASDRFGLLAYNLLNVPSLWAGTLGTWALGWFDVAMPLVVGFASIACYVAVGFTGFRSMSARKGIALAGVGLALIVVPVYVLTRGGSAVGSEVQPRYILPMVVLLAALLALRSGARSAVFTRGQLALVVVSLAVAHLVALYTTIRRYVTGLDVQSLDLDAGREWWWDGVPSPNVILVIGSLAYAGTVAMVAVAANRAARLAPPPGLMST